MSVSPEKRVMQWDRKYNVGRAMAAIEDQRPKMLERYEAAITALCNVEQMTREVLNERAIQTINYVWYLDYARQLFKLTRKNVAGDSLALAAKVLLDKWQSRGLDPDVLAAIRSQVFNIGPVAP
ncbi:MAG: hypothetical protein ABIL25_08240 [candidate division WOR-3 bacterium]